MKNKVIFKESENESKIENLLHNFTETNHELQLI